MIEDCSWVAVKVLCMELALGLWVQTQGQIREVVEEKGNPLFLLAPQMGLINPECTQQAILYRVCPFLRFLGLLIHSLMQFQPGRHCMGLLELFRLCLNLGVETLGPLVQILVVLLVAILLINRTLSKLWVG
uniref:Uncharacterized protein n=1 Tax=Arundo donax TaxID=35708 RepID=A0A0A9DYX1_ARUDO